MKFDLILHDGKIMNGVDEFPQNFDIGIKNDKIISVGDLKNESSTKKINCKNLIVLPGVIDTQVHFREPGLTHKEDIECASKAAVMGGVTAFCEMPNTNPLTTSEKELNWKLLKAKNVSWCDYSFFIGATPNNILKLSEYEKLPGCVGIKIFMGSSTGELLVQDTNNLFEILSNGQKRIAVHAEDEVRLKQRYNLFKNSNEPVDHPKIRDPKSALLATKCIMEIANKVKRPLHLLHISTASEMKLLKSKSQLITVEVTPQHLTLSSPDCYKENGTLVQMNPPIRSKYHQKELWNGIYNGTVDVIGSDHAPHTLEEKNNDYPNSPSGMPGIQTMLPLMLNEVSKKKLKLSKLVDLLCRRPAEIYKMKSRGLIQEGYKASLTVVDLNLTKSLDPKDIMSLCGWSPFTGKRLTGWPVVTIINGDVVMYKNKLVKRPNVYPVEFDEY